MPAPRDEILHAYRVPAPDGGDPNWPVFQVGCTSRPLNFASQQMRAFALMWALDSQASNGNWLKGKRVAIVGGGFAGVAAGITALRRGAALAAMYERAHEVIPLQHAATRDIRPFIFRWPQEGCLDKLLDEDGENPKHFPFLHWKQGTAHEVRKQVLTKAIGLYNRTAEDRAPAEPRTPNEDAPPWWLNRKKHLFFRQFFGTEVRRIVSDGYPGEVRLMAEGCEPVFNAARDEWLPVGRLRNFDYVYDVVIVAVGFGLERVEETIPFRSYWHTDSLAQPIFTGRTPWRVLISGTGDGGLTDAIRARLFDVDLTEAINILCGELPQGVEEKKSEKTEAESKTAAPGTSSSPAELKIAALAAPASLTAEPETVALAASASPVAEPKTAAPDAPASPAKPKPDWDKRPDWTNWPERCKALRERLVKLENEARTETNDNTFSELVERKYEALCQEGQPYFSSLETLSRFFLSRERTDTLVYLRGSPPAPYERGASPLFRFITFLLRRWCGLRYLCGDRLAPLPPARSPHDSFVVSVLRDGQVVERVPVDEVYIRHGADPALARLFGQKAYKTITSSPRAAEIQGVEDQLWNDTDENWLHWKKTLVDEIVDPKPK